MRSGKLYIRLPKLFRKEKGIGLNICLICFLAIIALFVCLMMLLKHSNQLYILLLPMLTAGISTVLAYQLYRKSVKQSHRKLLIRFQKNERPQKSPEIPGNPNTMIEENDQNLDFKLLPKTR